ncbi:MAG: DNA-processing protein DprA [Desulfobacterales bacterium]|jgi:DNA processing protein|nr:DNA-processing protein DprA [Desulfobacterales bacterium]
MENVLPWLMLKSVPGIGNVLLKRLIEHFQAPARVLGASVEALMQVDGISTRLAGNIRQHRNTDSIHHELNLIHRKKCRFVPLTTADYPSFLKEIPDPPPYLYVHGTLSDTSRCISVVGSRRASSYGLAVTYQLCRDLAAAGFTVVSGLASGIDTAAHNGALAGKGKTLAVLGSGLLNIYPRENERLAMNIAENGAVISEFPLEAKPEPHHFPARNRIISGLSLGTIIVEAAAKSGSLITARLALEQNREVFAVPGSIRSMKSSGAHGLIKQGAMLIDSARDVIEALAPMISGPSSITTPPGPDNNAPNGLSEQQRRILKTLSVIPVHIDELSRELSLPAGTLSGALLKLELQGLVRQSTGGFFYTIPPGG